MENINPNSGSRSHERRSPFTGLFKETPCTSPVDNVTKDNFIAEVNFKEEPQLNLFHVFEHGNFAATPSSKFDGIPRKSLSRSSQYFFLGFSFYFAVEAISWSPCTPSSV